MKDKIKNFFVIHKKVLLIWTCILIGFGIFLYLKPDSNSRQNNITQIQKKVDYKEQDKNFLDYLDKNKGKIIKISWLDIYIPEDWTNKWLEGFPKKKESLDKLLSKLKELWLNNKNTNFILANGGDLPWPFLSVIATDKERWKSIQEYKEQVEKGLKEIQKIDKQTAEILQDIEKNQYTFLGTKDSTWFCISSKPLWIEKWTSVQVCPDVTTLLRIVWKNKELVTGIPTVDTLYNMPDYTKWDIDKQTNWFKKIYNTEAYLLKYPYVLKYKDKLINYLVKSWYFNKVYSFDKFLIDSDVYQSKWIIRWLLWIIWNNGYDTKNNVINNNWLDLLNKTYNWYLEEVRKYNKKINKNQEKVDNNKIIPLTKDQFKEVIIKFAPLFYDLKEYNIKWFNKIFAELSKDKVWFRDYLRIFNDNFAEAEFNKLLDDKKYLSLFGKWLDKNKIKRITWFYIDTINMVPNYIVLLYPSTKPIIQIIRKLWLDDIKYKEIFNSGYLIQTNNTKNKFVPFLYDLANWWIILEPQDSPIFDWSEIWKLAKTWKKEDLKKINDIILRKNEELLKPNKFCLNAQQIQKDSWVKIFTNIFKCDVNNFALDTFDKVLDKLTRRASQMFSMLYHTKEWILPWLQDDKYILLVKMYPDILYWRFDTPEERKQFFETFKEALDILRNSTDKKDWQARFKRKMTKFYKYFNDIDDYKHLRVNLNTLNLVIYWQE